MSNEYSRNADSKVAECLYKNSKTQLMFIRVRTLVQRVGMFLRCVKNRYDPYYSFSDLKSGDVWNILDTL